MDSTTNSDLFALVSEELKQGNADFFYHELQENQTGFFFEVVLSYDEENLLTTNLDLSFFSFSNFNEP